MQDPRWRTTWITPMRRAVGWTARGQHTGGYLQVDRPPRQQEPSLGARFAHQQHRDSQSAAVAERGHRELDITSFGSQKLSRVVAAFQRRLGRLKARRSAGRDVVLLVSALSDEDLGPGPSQGTPCAPGGACQSKHPPCTCGSDGELDELLRADYKTSYGPLHSPPDSSRQGRAPEPAPSAYGPYGVLIDEAPDEDTELDIKRDDGDAMDDFGITPPRGERREGANRRHQEREEEEYMVGVHRGVLGGA